MTLWVPPGSVDPTRVDVDLDARSERMSGVAVHGNTPFDCPLISHVAPRLWTGGCVGGLTLPDEIEHVISLYPWEAYKVRRELRSHASFMLYDSAVPNEKLLHRIAYYAEGCVEDGTTLIHCQAGLNRSALVAALVLMRQGSSAADAIALLRERRSPAVLCNEAFEAWLLANDPPPPPPPKRPAIRA